MSQQERDEREAEKRLAAGLCEAEGWSGLDSPRCKKWRQAHERERRKRRTGRDAVGGSRDSTLDGEEAEDEEVMGDSEASRENTQLGTGGSMGMVLPVGGDDSFISMFTPADAPAAASTVEKERPSAG